jgi:uncharacterized protein (TIGR03435 family)
MGELAFPLRSDMRMLPRNDQDWAVEPPPVVGQTNLDGSHAIYLRITGLKDDLPAAIEPQLGLRLELRKIPTEILAIDSAAKPSAN